MSTTVFTSETALRPGLQILIDHGVLWRAERAERREESFATELRDAISRGEVTRGQADTIGHMLGVPHHHE